MSSYKELLQQREALEAQITQVRENEVSGAIAQIHAIMADFELTQEDLFPSFSGKTKGVKRPSGKVAPKYRNPATGDTWTGRGKPPKWIQDQERDAYLIAA
jgi:DNA-binding protein H-NS